jgi:hypothetical protein
MEDSIKMKLVVGGCSFSSSFNIRLEESWPALVAKQLNCDLLDEAAIAGSNYRIWRKIVNYIVEGVVTKDDTLIIQYTESHRTELFSPIKRRLEHDDRHSPAESYHDGYILKNKWGLELTGIGDEKKIGIMTRKFSCDQFDYERFSVEHTMFQGYLKSLGFNHVYFLIGGPYTPNINNITQYPIIDCSDTLKYHLTNDIHHMNAVGHKTVTQRILDVLKV